MLVFFFFFFPLVITASGEDEFTFNGFNSANLSLDGTASITNNGLLEVTNATQMVSGHAFHRLPLHFRSRAGKTISFSTTFVFAILSETPNLSGHGISFFVSRTCDLSTALPTQYLGLLNVDNDGNSANHILAVELDTVQNPELQDIDDNHVGIDVNSLKSIDSHRAGYYEDGTRLLKNLSLTSGQPMQVWIDFDGEETKLNVTLSPLKLPKPSRPLLSSTVDLSSLMLDTMYVGISSSTGSFRTRHYILGWSFKKNGVAKPLDYDKLPSLPVSKSKGSSSEVLATSLPVASCSFVLLIVASTAIVIRRRIKYAELHEDWELKYGPHRFSYKDLYEATKGFKESQLLGMGGFGRVYKGVLPTSKMEIAVKKISHGSTQGLREFVAEIVSIGQFRHRNLVQLLGYCRRKGEFLLVYDFMPNGSLDKLLHDCTKTTLNWAQRFQIIKGVASGLLYLHEDWEQVVIHRDIKASNVLLDGDLNGRLGDFGLARLYDRGTDPQTTRVVGTMGYLAPELAISGKATTSTDVFAFGTFLLEVVCGRRPIATHSECEDLVLVEWVYENWRRGSLIDTMDSRLRDEYRDHEVELVLKLGLLCSHPVPESRPSMRRVMQILDGDAQLPELSQSFLSLSSLSLYQNAGFDNYIMSFNSSAALHSSVIVGGDTYLCVCEN